ncbi:hypothetical protein LZ554_005090 [Drepanopeziza brunnea f. sp. 'monogermtubi']|nr:hypothetical protein LZ554_005090 [Drepanopeziza brunnea f. sp. 'monogermtubi']
MSTHLRQHPSMPPRRKGTKVLETGIDTFQTHKPSLTERLTTLWSSSSSSTSSSSPHSTPSPPPQAAWIGCRLLRSRAAATPTTFPLTGDRGPQDAFRCRGGGVIWHEQQQQHDASSHGSTTVRATALAMSSLLGLGTEQPGGGVLHPLAGLSMQRDLFIHSRAQGLLAVAVEVAAVASDLTYYSPATSVSPGSKREENKKQMRKSSKRKKSCNRNVRALIENTNTWLRSCGKKVLGCDNQGGGPGKVGGGEGVEVEVGSESDGSVVNITFEREGRSHGFSPPPPGALYRERQLDFQEPAEEIQDEDDIFELIEIEIVGEEKKAKEKKKNPRGKYEEARRGMKVRLKSPNGSLNLAAESEIRGRNEDWIQGHARGELTTTSDGYVKLEVRAVETIPTVAVASQYRYLSLALQEAMETPIPSSSVVSQSNSASSQDPQFSDTKSLSTTHLETKSKTAEEIIDIDNNMASSSPISTPSTVGPSYSLIVGPANLETDFYGSYFGTPPPDRITPLKSYQRRPHPRTQDPSWRRTRGQAQDDGDSSPRQTSYPALDDEHATLEDFGFLPTITPAIKERLAEGWTGFEEVEEVDDGFDFSKPEVGGGGHEAVARTRSPNGD